MNITPPFLLFLGDAKDQLAAKTAAGIVEWRPEWCVGQFRLAGCKADIGQDDLTPAEARARGAQTLVLGIAASGGMLPEHWIEPIADALRAGLDVASGLHVRLEDVPALAEAARSHGCRLHNVRHPDRTFATGNGKKRRGRRLLTVGTDCSVGKKYTALAIERGLRDAGWDADFRATGQTGILISGRGVAVDAVVADFISGAAEWISPEAGSDHHWDVVEGQGSLFHPSFAGVTLGLLHGTQPDAFVVCHDPTRRTMRGVETPQPTIRQVIDQTIALGQLTNPAVICVGIAINSSSMGEPEARRYLHSLEAEYGVPATDPIRFGVAGIIDRMRTTFRQESSGGDATIRNAAGHSAG